MSELHKFKVLLLAILPSVENSHSFLFFSCKDCVIVKVLAQLLKQKSK